MGLSFGPAGTAGAAGALFFADVALTFFAFDAFFRAFGAVADVAADVESRPPGALWAASGKAPHRRAATAAKTRRRFIGTAGGK
jgi:hypothetical protein